MAEWLLSDRERLIEQIARCERDYGSDHVLLKADRDEFESKFVKAAQDAANLRLRVEELEEELLEWREGLARSIGMRENP
jgi:hypothetical protein